MLCLFAIQMGCTTSQNTASANTWGCRVEMAIMHAWLAAVLWHGKACLVSHPLLCTRVSVNKAGNDPSATFVCIKCFVPTNRVLATIPADMGRPRMSARQQQLSMGVVHTMDACCVPLLLQCFFVAWLNCSYGLCRNVALYGNKKLLSCCCCCCSSLSTSCMCLRVCKGFEPEGGWPVWQPTGPTKCRSNLGVQGKNEWWRLVLKVVPVAQVQSPCE